MAVFVCSVLRREALLERRHLSACFLYARFGVGLLLLDRGHYSCSVVVGMLAVGLLSVRVAPCSCSCCTGDGFSIFLLFLCFLFIFLIGDYWWYQTWTVLRWCVS